ncbi:glycoside hydrolase family 13 protein [Corynebacterium tapiri]|uniref:Glycoside hydrolase family 13 protein n=1 Tax=Corynebacterium tapiri TaxID=1448266 RepID=A0A5C4U2M4_9CORY|nr:glycoside hydrolase family 13 protein [Corynebacterium tapiri]TNL95598.1 glycoside hydrolase family 13 protein [Corynebacterium tapiri]
MLIDDKNWWRQAAVYQIYPRSFADANGDGLGDLQGVISRADYLKSLHIDAVWLSPFYPSALADGGYDVDDYRNVDPRIGTLEDFDEMVQVLHERGIRVIVDLVPNHTSNLHEWFQAALKAGPGSPERARYIFREGRGENGELPPTDWTSIFGGPSWTRVEDGQWYLHNFAPEQPDLNWKNPEVHEDFIKTLRFWLDRGADGFRVDVAHGLAKDLPEDAASLPSKAELDAMPVDGTHPLWDRDEVHEIYREWREVLNEYTPARTAVAEAWVETSRRPHYSSPDGLGQAFNFDLLDADFSAPEFRHLIAHNLELSDQTGSSSTWVFSNHDVVRHATRFGLPLLGSAEDIEHPDTWIKADQAKHFVLTDGAEPALDRELGLRRARAATLLELALPGSAYMYQGEELGLHEVVEISDDQRQDPTFFRSPGVEKGRDGCRVPLPWTAEGESFGFGQAAPHLPQPAWFAEVSVEKQDGKDGSTLSMYREALALRRELLTEDESLTWIDELCGEYSLAFERAGGWVTVMNFGDDPIALPAGKVLLSSGPLAQEGELPGATTVWLQR